MSLSRVQPSGGVACSTKRSYWDESALKGAICKHETSVPTTWSDMDDDMTSPALEARVDEEISVLRRQVFGIRRSVVERVPAHRSFTQRQEFEQIIA